MPYYIHGLHISHRQAKVCYSRMTNNKGWYSVDSPYGSEVIYSYRLIWPKDPPFFVKPTPIPNDQLIYVAAHLVEILNEDLHAIFGQYGQIKEIRETPNKKHHIYRI